MFAPRILPYVFSGLPKNVCREVAQRIRGKWEKTKLRYERSERPEGGVLGRAGANRPAGRVKHRKIDISQIQVMHGASSCSTAPSKPMAPRKVFANSGSGSGGEHRSAASTTPLGKLIATLDFELVPRATLSKTVAASAATLSESQKFTEIMTAARKNLFVRYEVKFAGLMEKSGAELRAAEIECDAAYQKIYLKEFDAFLGEERGAGKISERALEQAHVHAAAVAVEYLGASGSIDDRNYARFLSTFKLAFVPKAPGIPPRSGVVAYRGGTGLLQPREESNSREI